jgi:hypothetical protein
MALSCGDTPPPLQKYLVFPAQGRRLSPPALGLVEPSVFSDSLLAPPHSGLTHPCQMELQQGGERFRGPLTGAQTRNPAVRNTIPNGRASSSLYLTS